MCQTALLLKMLLIALFDNHNDARLLAEFLASVLYV